MRLFTHSSASPYSSDTARGFYTYMPDDPFRSPKQKLARAQEHIRDFEAACKIFIEGNPYARSIEVDTDGVTKLHKIKLTQDIPDRLTDLAQDSIEALRHTLDQIGYACALLAGKANPRCAYFPFASSGGELAAVIRGRCKDIPSDIVSVFRSYQPYQGGNDELWAMSKIANAKHTVLVPVGHASEGFRMKRGTIRGPGAIMCPRWDSEKQEMVFAKSGPGGDIEYDVEFAFYIAFGNVPIFEGRPVLDVLKYLANVVDSIITATEAECRRIGLL